MSLKILFLCGHNSGRSIAAEAICKKIRPELKASSAGTKPGKRINPEVKKSLQKKDFSVVGLFPKSIDDVGGLSKWNKVITMGCMERNCPVIPEGIEHEDWNLPDPATNTESIDKTIQILITKIKKIN